MQVEGSEGSPSRNMVSLFRKIYLYLHQACQFRLYTKTPTAGGRVFEIGDEKLLQLAHNKGSELVHIIIWPILRLMRVIYNSSHPHRIHSIRQTSEDEGGAPESCAQSHSVRIDSSTGRSAGIRGNANLYSVHWKNHELSPHTSTTARQGLRYVCLLYPA